MWPPTDEAREWYDAMTAQTLHEIDCEPCRRYRVPAPGCAEGLRLQQEARAAHERWVTARYAGLAAAS